MESLKYSIPDILLTTPFELTAICKAQEVQWQRYETLVYSLVCLTAYSLSAVLIPVNRLKFSNPAAADDFWTLTVATLNIYAISQCDTRSTVF